MYFIPFIRDYVDIINNSYDYILNDLNFQKIIQETFIYFLQTIKFVILYVLTFQWLRDFIYLPTIIPKISSSILKENLFLEAPLENFLNFIEYPTYNNNKFFIGFFNSFFLSLPLSCAQLISVRRLLVQGNIAGIVAGLGTIFGQLLFIGSVILGFRFLIAPWFFFEPLNYIIGLFLLINIVYEMIHERVIKIVDWTDRSLLLKIFLLNFFLIWTEQTCLFQFFGNLTSGSEISILDIFSSTNNFDFLKNHINYLVGLFIGCLGFNVIFAFCVKKLTEYIAIKFSLLRSTWIIQLNFVLLSFILAFSFSSIPYYGLDFLLTGPLGFISNDKVFKKTIFSQNELKDPIGILGALSDNLSLDTDVTSFDRGFYLKYPILQTFEDLNFSGEYASTVRQGNIPLFDQYKDKARKIREIIIQKDENDIIDKKTKTPSKLTIENKKNSQLEYYPTYYPIDRTVYLSSNIYQRFENNYKEASNNVFEGIVQGTLNNVFSEEKFTVSYPQLEQKLKNRYYENPIYKFLLTIDIDNFLRRQPSGFLLSSNEERNLYKKRLMIGRYHDTLRFYNQLPYNEEFQFSFNGSKSFSDRVYNQQFKGTLFIVRRLFSISFNQTFSTKKLNSAEKILKYDQPLFKDIKEYNFNFHEELKQESSLTSPFLETLNQTPLYIGWDNSLKKIVISNRILPKTISNFKKIELKNKNLIEFTSWPIKTEQLIDKSENPRHSQVLSNSKFLFETKSSIKKLNYNNLLPLFEAEDRGSNLSYYDSLPNNITKLSGEIIDIIPPNRSGFIWPGTNFLNLSFNFKK